MMNMQVFNKSIVILFCIIIINGCSEIKQKYYNKGYSEGYSEGVQAGKNSISNIGFKKGLKKGLQEGQINGFKEGNLFFITEQIAPTLAGWLLVVAFITWSTIFYKITKKPIINYINNFNEKLTTKRKIQSLQDEIKIKSKLSLNSNYYSDFKKVISLSSKINLNELYLIEQHEKEKLEDDFLLKIHNAKNNFVTKISDEFIQISNEIKESTHLKEVEKVKLLNKIEAEFIKNIESIWANQTVNQKAKMLNH